MISAFNFIIEMNSGSPCPIEPTPNAQHNKKRAVVLTALRTPSGTRTLDPLIKSQLLYQLS